MADLRSRFLEDYAGGMLNVARQELSTTGEVLVQDGFTSEGTLFVEDGAGVKSGLRLGISLVEVVDPTTDTGVVNVRFADRTYAKVRDLKIFSTAIASAQAALADAASTSISNLETTVQLLEDTVDNIEQNFQQILSNTQDELSRVSEQQITLTSQVETATVDVAQLDSRVTALEVPSATRIEIESFPTETNANYYTGTITITSGAVTGVSTVFNTELEEGSVFVAVSGSGLSAEEVEFTVKSFDTADPATKINVVPTNKNVAAGSKFRVSTDMDIKLKINQILSVMRESKLII